METYLPYSVYLYIRLTRSRTERHGNQNAVGRSAFPGGPTERRGIVPRPVPAVGRRRRRWAGSTGRRNVASN